MMPVTINGLTLHRACGRPLPAGEIQPGTTVSFDPHTGKILKIEPPEES